MAWAALKAEAAVNESDKNSSFCFMNEIISLLYKAI